MSYQNRVDPWGNLHAVANRGTLMGNRGSLHNSDKKIVREYRNKSWLICALNHKGINREVMKKGAYTELFFLDEATALSAGHRPCSHCQADRHNIFKRYWLEANTSPTAPEELSIKEIDQILHTERSAIRGETAYSSKFELLPDGVLIEHENQAYLLWKTNLFLWSFSGYTKVEIPLTGKTIKVLTPESIVKSYTRGFTPHVHLNIP